MTPIHWFYQTFPNLLIVFLVVFQTIRPETEDEEIHKLSIDIYYSVMDPKSAQFLSDRVEIVLNSNLAKYTNIHIFPFAGCKLIAGKISCILGKYQEEASLHHMCAFNLLSEQEDSSTGALLYIICTLEKMSETQLLDYEGCTDKAEGSIKAIEDCINKEDNHLIAENFKRINKLKFGKYPSIAINGKFSYRGILRWDQFIWDQMCSGMGTFKPLECRNETNEGYGYLKQQGYQLAISLFVLTFL